jgi:hypothetical protein
LLFHFPAILLPVPFAGQRLLGPELLARLQIEGMAFHFFDNVLLLDFSFEAAKGVFQRFALLKLYFSQTNYTSRLDQISVRLAGEFMDRPMKILKPVTLKNPALHTEGTDIIGG